MSLILNQVPYEVKINAIDLGSSKKISNTVYYRSDPAVGFGYGDPITGTNDATFIADVLAAWVAAAFGAKTAVHQNYKMVDITSQAIIGRGFNTAITAILSALAGVSATTVVTATAHGLTTGDKVFINGAAGMTSLNNIWSNITVVDSITFTIPASIPGTYTGGGLAQKANKPQQFQYSNKLVVPDSTVGLIGGEALPLYCDVSMRRLNTGVGKNWKSRLSIAIVSELHNIDGKLTAGALIIWTAFGNNFASIIPATGVGGLVMRQVAVSRQIAFAQPTPFLEAGTWTRPVTDWVPQPNFGSFTRRKPKLTQTIV